MGSNPLAEKAAEAKRTRPVYEYDIPEGLADGVKTVGLVELTAQEELMAVKRAGGDAYRLAYELAKQAVAEVNGQKVSLADGSTDQAFDRMPPKVRNLVLSAYAELHAPPEDAIEGFRASRRVRVG